ncbi:MAG: hypothetical protein IKV97_01430 [Clostridia bacterium]|nr:hypothetical protein [Clostridia bacterium]
MTCSAGIHILTDRKAKILNALKSSLHDAERLSELSEIKNAGEQISNDSFKKQFDEINESFGDAFSQNTAIVLYDDYISLVYEEADLDTILNQAMQYSEIFGRPVFFTATPDSDTVLFGAAKDGKLQTKLYFGEYLDEFGLDPERINMDLLSYIFNSRNLTDLNECVSASDVIYALEEDYGIFAELSPLSMPLFDDKYKVLEKSTTFSVYSAL